MYRGQTADFPCGSGGLNGNQNVYQIPITHLTKARNIRFDGYTWTKAPGLALYDSSAISGTPTCKAGFDWRPDQATQRQITAWSNGSVYKEVSGNVDSVTLISGLTFSNPVVFVEGGATTVGDDRKLYLYSKGVAPKQLVADGATMVGITAESIDWAGSKPGAATYHDVRVFVYDVDGAPHNFYISTLNDHGDFASEDSRAFQVAPGHGDKIVCMWSFLPNQLYAFKYPRGIWTVDTTDVTSFYLPISIVRDDVGMSGPLGIAKVGADTLFISSQGRLYSLNALRPDIDPTQADITAQLRLTKFIQDNVNINRLNFARLIYDELRKEIWYIFTSKDGTVNDSALIIDVNELNVPKIAYEDRGELFEAMWKSINSSGSLDLLTAGTGGLVYRANSENRAIGTSTAYVGEFEYPATDFKHINQDLAGINKRFDFLEIIIVPTGDYTMSFEISIDGVSRKTVTIGLGDTSVAFDDVDALFDTAMFGGLGIVKHKVPLDLIGDQITIRGYNSALNENFIMADIRVDYKVSDTSYEG